MTTPDAPSRPITIAFIGLGHMGGPMAANLARAGHSVTGFDVVPQALTVAASNGISVAGSAEQAVGDAELVITMLPSGKHVLSCYIGDGAGGILAAAKPGTLFLDCSTIDVADARAAHATAIKAGQRALDAPVSGGVVGATAGTLTFMVGANPADFEQA
ncbi:MAG TPA: NAD(P)-binding domain-containing protein, partial [Candidatus Acidoferrum sp.]|nr:NAD(P)-binding domain-containing protein [Candidatus Acidoferrum sp.]